MNLLCPNCQKPISVLEQYAGQPMQCPLCSGTFTVPALPATEPAAHAVSAPETYGLRHEPGPPPPATESSAHPEVAFPPSAAARAAPPAPGEYAHGFTWRVNPRVVPWLAPVGLLLVFILSFFSWRPFPLYLDLKMPPSLDSLNNNAWQWGFVGDHLSVWMALYDLLTFLVALPLAVAVLLIDLKIIPDVPALHAVRPWRSLIVAGVSGLAWLFFLFECLRNVFNAWIAPIVTAWAVLAFWIHLIAVIGVLLAFWLERRGPNRPLPRLDAHW
jgi:hypothetical protein